MLEGGKTRDVIDNVSKLCQWKRGLFYWWIPRKTAAATEVSTVYCLENFERSKHQVDIVFFNTKYENKKYNKICCLKICKKNFRNLTGLLLKYEF